jgi:hypothetical protein
MGRRSAAAAKDRPTDRTVMTLGMSRAASRSQINGLRRVAASIDRFQGVQRPAALGITDRGVPPGRRRSTSQQAERSTTKAQAVKLSRRDAGRSNRPGVQRRPTVPEPVDRR